MFIRWIKIKLDSTNMHGVTVKKKKKKKINSSL